MTFELPFPPSVNHYWGTNGHRRFIKPAGVKFRRDALILIQSARNRRIAPTPVLEASVTVEVYPPDRRRRDLDNLLKPILDALQHSGVILDDYHIGELVVRRYDLKRGGMVRVHVTPLV